MRERLPRRRPDTRSGLMNPPYPVIPRIRPAVEVGLRFSTEAAEIYLRPLLVGIIEGVEQICPRC